MIVTFTNVRLKLHAIIRENQVKKKKARVYVRDINQDKTETQT